MKMKIFCLMAWAAAMTATPLIAQTFTTLHSFTSGSGADGSNPDVIVAEMKKAGSSYSQQEIAAVQQAYPNVDSSITLAMEGN